MLLADRVRSFYWDVDDLRPLGFSSRWQELENRLGLAVDHRDLALATDADKSVTAIRTETHPIDASGHLDHVSLLVFAAGHFMNVQRVMFDIA